MKKMKVNEERARFCDSCNCVIGWYSRFCEECGNEVGAAKSGKSKAPAPAAESTDPRDSVEKELFQAHMRLVHRFRERVEKLKKNLRRSERALKGLEMRARDPKAHGEILRLSERLVDLEQEWEDTQHDYNRQSEGIEESFLEKIDELQADLELAPDHQEAISEEVQALLASLEEANNHHRELSRWCDVLRARHGGGAVGWGSSRQGSLLIGLLIIAFALGGFAYGLYVEKLPLKGMGIAMAPSLIGILILFMLLRVKERI